MGLCRLTAAVSALIVPSLYGQSTSTPLDALIPGDSRPIAAMRKENTPNEAERIRPSIEWLVREIELSTRNVRIRGKEEEELNREIDRTAPVIDRLTHQHRQAELRFLLEALLAQRIAIGGEEESSIVHLSCWLAGCYFVANNSNVARRHFEKAIDVCRRITVEEAESSVGIIELMTSVFLARDELDTARIGLAGVREIRRRIDGYAGDQDDAKLYDRRAGENWNKNEIAKALLLFEHVLEIRRDLSGDNNPLTAQSYFDVAKCHARLGKLGEADSLLTKSLEIRMNLLGTDHADTASSQAMQAFVQHRLGNQQKAIDYAKKALPQQIRAYGSRHEIPHDTCLDLVAYLTANGDSNPAKSLLAKHELQVEQSSKSIRLRLAELCLSLGEGEWGRQEYAAAWRLIEKSHALYFDVLGANARETAKSAFSLGVVLHELGELDHARLCME